MTKQRRRKRALVTLSVIIFVMITLKVLIINKKASLVKRYEYFAENDSESKSLNIVSDLKSGALRDKLHRSKDATISLQKPVLNAKCNYNVSSKKLIIKFFYA